MITIVGATATGKTGVATNLAKAISGEIISADSRQLYRGMDIGTGKDICEYTIDSTPIPYHLIDIVDAGYRYNLYEFQQGFKDSFEKIKANGNFPILCGGSGMYVESILNNYQLKDPIDIPEINSLVIGILFSREERRDRITTRLHQRLEEGMIQEVEGLLKSGLTPEDLIYYGLEYKYLTEYIIGKYSKDEMISKLNIAIHQFAKRQMTWFRKMERSGCKINWIDGNLPTDEKISIVQDLLSQP